MTHLEHLSRLVPGMEGRRVLDIGSGRGAFVISAAQAGIDATGLEYNPAYIARARTAAAKAGVHPQFVEGKGEHLPFSDGSFDFVNLSEVIEHVEAPEALLHEAARVLAPGGLAYVSAPNRFGFRDPHFHLYGVNWVPRSLADAYITLFGKHKDYGNLSAGRQRLREMHYYTYAGALALAQACGFEATDIRELRINHEFRGLNRTAARLIYPFLRAIRYDTFHLLLRKR